MLCTHTHTHIRSRQLLRAHYFIDAFAILRVRTAAQRALLLPRLELSVSHPRQLWQNRPNNCAVRVLARGDDGLIKLPFFCAIVTHTTTAMHGKGKRFVFHAIVFHFIRKQFHWRCTLSVRARTHIRAGMRCLRRTRAIHTHTHNCIVTASTKPHRGNLRR